MKKLFLTTIIIAMTVVSAIAQDDRLDDFTFDTEPIQRESIPYFAVAGGAIVGFHFANYDALNEQIDGFGFDDSFEGQLTMWGAQGFTGTVFVPNLRIGFFGMSGTKTISKDITTDGSTSTRYMDYSVGQSGLSLDYALVPFKSFAILPGVSVGRGELTVETYQTSGDVSWPGFAPTPVNQTNLQRLENGYWFVKPELYFEYALTNFLMFRASAAYNMTFGSKWKYNNESEIADMPDKFNANALQVQVGLFLGLFNY